MMQQSPSKESPMKRMLIWIIEIALVLFILLLLAAMWLPAYIGGTPERMGTFPSRGAPAK